MSVTNIKKNDPPPKTLQDKYDHCCYKETAQTALDEISLFYVNRFKRMWKEQKTRTHTRVQRWVNSSRINFYFGIWMADTYLNNKSFSVTQIVNEMHITRTTARKLIADTLGEGWLVAVPNLKDKRIINYQCTKYYYTFWESYIAYTVKISNYQDFRKSIDIYKYSLEKMDATNNYKPKIIDNKYS